MKRLAVVLTLALLLLPSLASAQDFCPKVRQHVRAVSVSIESAKGCVGSGTIFHHAGYTYCVTCAHVTHGMDHSEIYVSQYCPDDPKQVKSILAKLTREDKDSDVSILKLGKGVYPVAATISRAPHKLDAPILHCGAMDGLHGSLARGYIVGLHRDVKNIFPKAPAHSQADITAWYGSSGGGVFDKKGQFIGMVTSGASARIIFVIPAHSMGLCFCDDCPEDCDCGCKCHDVAPAKDGCRKGGCCPGCK